MNKTAQREAIISELRACCSHPTADELYDMLRRKMPQISLGTVYRNLEQMSQLGLIRKLALAGHQKRFDGRLEPHYHIRCPECDAITDVPATEMAELEKSLEEILQKLGCDGFNVELTAVCDHCRSEAAIG